MNGDILTFFLLSAVLTFHGTEAQLSNCGGICENICRNVRGNQGLNCCFGTQGGYGDPRPGATGTRPDGVLPANKYDSFNGISVCRSGNCNIGHVYPGYMASLLIKIKISFHFLIFFIFNITEINYFSFYLFISS